MNHCFHAATHPGFIRQSNEDCYGISGLQIDAQATNRVGPIDARSGWMILADGMGGHASGDVASRVAVECWCSIAPELNTPADITSALRAMDAALHDAIRHDEKFRGMGTTVAGMLLRADHALLFNVGDSRIYLAAEGNLRQMSCDHVVEGHVLTQCLGGLGSPRRLEPYVATQRLPHPSRLLLCTDGLTDLIRDDAIASILRSSGTPARDLVDAALSAGGTDNVTAMVMDIA